MTDIKTLKALAEAATQGEWWIDSHGHRMVSHGERGSVTVFLTDDCMGPATRHPETGNLSHWPNDWDASFIAAANPAAVLELIAEIERLRQFEAAYKEYSDKTNWVQESAHWSELGMHRADVLRGRIDQLKTENESLRAQLAVPSDVLADCEELRKDAERYRWLTRNWFTMTTSYSGGVKFHTGGERWSALSDGSVDEAIDAAMKK